MVIPRFSVRSALIGTAICAVFCFVLTLAVNGSPWAIAASVAVLSLLVILVFHAFTYLVTLAFTKVIGQQQMPALTSQGGLQSTSTSESTSDQQTLVASEGATAGSPSASASDNN